MLYSKSKIPLRSKKFWSICFTDGAKLQNIQYRELWVKKGYILYMKYMLKIADVVELLHIEKRFKCQFTAHVARTNERWKNKYLNATQNRVKKCNVNAKVRWIDEV